MIYFRMNTFLIMLFFAWITVSSHPADSVQTKFGSKEIQIGVGGFGPTLQKAISALNERNKKANNIEKDEPIQTESFSQEKKDGEQIEEENPSETETVSPSEQQTESTSPTTTTTTVSSSDTTTQQTTTESSVDETTVTITTTAKTELPEVSPPPGTTTLRPEQNNGSKMNPSLVLQMGIFFLTITYLLELKL